jgi:hypothetical protein
VFGSETEKPLAPPLMNADARRIKMEMNVMTAEQENKAKIQESPRRCRGFLFLLLLRVGASMISMISKMIN